MDVSRSNVEICTDRLNKYAEKQKNRQRTTKNINADLSRIFLASTSEQNEEEKMVDVEFFSSALVFENPHRMTSTERLYFILFHFEISLPEIESISLLLCHAPPICSASVNQSDRSKIIVHLQIVR